MEHMDMYDNSKDALAHIMREHGVDVLLSSRLKNFFNDYAPGMKKSRKNVVSLVVESGAAEILKRSIGAGAEEQEIAFRQAVQKVIGEYPIERSEVECVMLEFTAVLGWKVNIQPQNPPKPVQQKQSAPARTALSDLSPGQRNVSFGNYLWRVLDVWNGRGLLLTEEILEKRRYHSNWESVTWENCELRKYLNGEFLRSFGSSEQERIAQTENTNKDNQWYGTSGGRSTVDRVFLLSIEEVVKYFGDSGDLRARKGWYWEKEKDVLKDGKGYYINDQYNSARKAKYRGERAWWWLRSPGDIDDGAARVDSDGGLNLDGYNVNYGGGGVRPALWLNL